VKPGAYPTPCTPSGREELSIDNYFTIKYFIWWEQVHNHMINRVGKMCVAAVSLCMIALIVTRKRGDGRYYFALWQTNNTPNKLLLSDSTVSCLLRVRSAPFTSRAKGCIKCVPNSCLVSLSHKAGVFLEEAICYFMYAKFDFPVSDLILKLYVFSTCL
jgi:hypothetical protein